MNRDQLLDYLMTNVSTGEETDVLVADCNNIVFLLTHCEISLNDANTFFVQVNCDGLQRQITDIRASQFRGQIEKENLQLGENNRAYTGIYDFSHTTAEWKTVMTLGIYGLMKRLEEYEGHRNLDAKQKRFYAQSLRVYTAVLQFMERAADTAKYYGKQQMAESLNNLCRRSPGNLFEAMQTIIIYYTVQHMIEGTLLRTLGRLDSLLYPYYQKEDKEYALSLIHAFFKEIDTLRAPSNIPFAIGGRDKDGNSLVNELSYLLLDAYHAVPTVNTKMHLLCADNTPDDLIELALDGVRNGKNSIVFMSDNKITEALEKLGSEHDDAADYHIVGCYECGANGELTCSCNARVNIVKAVEAALNNGRDMITGDPIGLSNNGSFLSFEAFYQECERQLLYFAERAMIATDIYERNYRYIHSAPVLSATYQSSMEKGGDLYCDYSAKYNNSSLNAIGLATAVDSLAAIRKLVYEDRTMSLSDLTDILRSNWEGQEILRLQIKNKFPKYGVGDAKTDQLAKRIVEALSSKVNGRKNQKGGVYRLGTFSIDWRWDFGTHTAASADGRRSGEPLSQNTGATFGADKEGLTAHMLSVTAFDPIHTPNASILDADIHSSAVRGSNGLNALRASLKTYFELGGFCVHYNILDTETLKKARLCPKDYPNLQVRLCGWNVLFSSLSDKEKDEFIARSQKQVTA